MIKFSLFFFIYIYIKKYINLIILNVEHDQIGKMWRETNQGGTWGEESNMIYWEFKNLVRVQEKERENL